jgi:triacylglycerol lipase
MMDILLIHGIDDTHQKVLPMAQYLQSQGFNTHVIDLSPNNGDVSLGVLAKQVKTKVDLLFENKKSADGFGIVGFSLGGIVARYYLQRLEHPKVNTLVTLASPHHGTVTGWLRNNTGSQELRLRSLFLADLNQQDDTQIFRQVSTVYSLYTPFDAMICPFWSSNIKGAVNIKIPVLHHGAFASDRRVMLKVRDCLQESLLIHSNNSFGLI